VNLYPFARVAREPGVDLEELIEQIDIGGPTLVRAAAKNHASVAIVTDPREYLAIVDELRTTGLVGEETRRRLAVEAFRHTADYDARIAEVLPERLGLSSTDLALREAEREEGEAPVAISPFPVHLDLSLERVQLLRYGENPHQAAALYRTPGADPASGPFATGVDLRQGKPLSYNNLLDASAAAGVARDLHGAACAIVKHTNPCGVCETDDIVVAWDRAFDCDRDSAFGGVVAVNQPIGPALAERLVSIFLEVVVAPAIEDGAAEVLARRPNLRVVVDPWLTRRPARNEIEYRSAGGGMLATESDLMPDDPAAWRLATTRPATERELADLGLAWRVVRHVKSNGIVLVKDGAIAGIGAGQMSRVDAARIAVEKAGTERVRGAVCASDAFYPFPDGVQVCAEAGVTAFVQPGGSLRDGEVIAAAEAAGATMLLTGVRHFRH